MATHPPARIYMNIDPDAKEKATEVYEKLGMNLTTAITLFLNQSIREQALPFTPTLEPVKAHTLDDFTDDFVSGLKEAHTQAVNGEGTSTDQMRVEFADFKKAW
ncbi:MAG TPA: type II toxin-antitoxin system RelB/DinJ family antitoxin [Lactobacillaceae bacterium]|jgi:addiction module RelB/DinJ family antitoxin